MNSSSPSKERISRFTVKWAADCFARQLCAGILGHDPSPKDLAFYAAFIRTSDGLESLTEHLLLSNEFQLKYFAGLAPEITRALYRGILGREPDSAGFENLSRQLTQKENIERVAAGLVTSDEFQRKRFAALAPSLVQALYRGILGREAAPTDLDASTERFTQQENIEALASGLVTSDEFQHQRFAALAPKLVQALYRGILGREPDQEGLDAFTRQVSKNETFEGMAATLVTSDEFQRKRFAALAPDLVQALYLGILGREAGAEELQAFNQRLTPKEYLEQVAASLVTSEEFRRKAIPFQPSDMVQALYRGILGRDADPENLDASAQQLSQKENLEQLAASLVTSGEFQHQRFAALAPELVQALYRGILDREPDPGGLEAFTRQVSEKANLPRVIATLANSDEARRKRFASLAPALAQALYRGILDRDPEPEELEASARQLTQKEGLEPVVAGLVTSDEFRRKVSPFPAPAIVRALYRCLLDRDPEPEELEASTRHLAQNENIEELAASLVTSGEARAKQFSFPLEELAQALYRAILGRDPNPQELEDFTQQPAQIENLNHFVAGLLASEEFQLNHSAYPVSELAQALHRGILGREPNPKDLENFIRCLDQKDKLEGAISMLIKSGEFRHRCFAFLAPEILQALYSGILGREPDPAGLKVYSARLAADHSLDTIAYELFQSQEYRRKSFATLSRPLLEGLYQGALNRGLDQRALNTYKTVLAQTGDIAPVLSKLINSHEFRRNYAAAEGAARAKAHARACDGASWVFIHVPKTGGTSIQHLLAAAFPPDKLYREHNDTLSQQPLEKLLSFSMFAGHFNYDSIAFIPRKSISLLTFVREPIDRLCSYYNFLRAHEPGNVMYARFHQAANELDMESFFRNSEITVSFEVWNQMTWSLMGARQWEAWQLRLAWDPDTAANQNFIDTVARPAIRQRLREFSFIGLQDDFDRSARMLCQVLGLPQPEVIPAQNALVDLMKQPDYKKELKTDPLTPARRQVLESLVQLDRVLYDESKIIYHEKLAQEAPPAPSQDNGSSALCISAVEA